jgi:hypothetical protein
MIGEASMKRYGAIGLIRDVHYLRFYVGKDRVYFDKKQKNDAILLHLMK